MQTIPHHVVPNCATQPTLAGLPFRRWVHLGGLWTAAMALAAGCGEGVSDTRVDIFEIKEEDTQVIQPDAQVIDTSDIGLIPLCTTDQQCPGTGNPCREAFCTTDGVCNTRPVKNGALCVDGNPCLGDDRCTDGVCKGTETDCNDNTPCTKDFCDPKTGCIHQIIEGPCDTGDACVLAACQSGGCVVTDTDVCDDGNPCTKDTCNAKLGCQFFALTDVPCEDGDGCTTGDKCLFGVCTGEGKSCTDGNPCTQDNCDLAGDCTHTASFDGQKCSDGSLCTVKDACNSGSCSGTPKNCNDNDECSVDSCVATTGACKSVSVADGSPCSDSNPCTVGDGCKAGACISGIQSACEDGNPCTAGSCNTETGKCSHPLLDDNLPCNLQDPCQLEPKCKSGTCVGTFNQCDDGNACTVDACDPLTGGCDHITQPNGTACGNGLACNNGLCL
jgi:hypothetical protein